MIVGSSRGSSIRIVSAEASTKVTLATVVASFSRFESKIALIVLRAYSGEEAS